MAGNISNFAPFLSIKQNPFLSLSFPQNRKTRNLLPPPLFLIQSPMAENGITNGVTNGVKNSVENGVHEPSPKIPKLSSEVPSIVPLLKVKKLSTNAILPTRASHLSAGYDLSSATEAIVKARSKALVPTDLSIAIPEGTYARIAPRSGLAWKHSIDVGAGVIDADYRGPIGVVLFNHSDVDFEVKLGDRVAQLIIEKIMLPEVVEIDDLDSTVRGLGGFGSTGV